MNKSGKHCGKKRNCSFWAISSFVTMFSKSHLLQKRQKASIWGKGLKPIMIVDRPFSVLSSMGGIRKIVTWIQWWTVALGTTTTDVEYWLFGGVIPWRSPKNVFPTTVRQPDIRHYHPTSMSSVCLNASFSSHCVLCHSALSVIAYMDIYIWKTKSV